MSENHPPPLTRYWFKTYHNSDFVESLLRENHHALILLFVVAQRASRGDKHGGLQRGQAEIGDFGNYGLTEKAYRIAKGHLLKRGLVSFQTSNQGTIATLLDYSLFDLSPFIRAGNAQPQSSMVPATLSLSTTHKGGHGAGNGAGNIGSATPAIATCCDVSKTTKGGQKGGQKGDKLHIDNKGGGESFRTKLHTLQTNSYKL